MIIKRLNRHKVPDKELNTKAENDYMKDIRNSQLSPKDQHALMDIVDTVVYGDVTVNETVWVFTLCYNEAKIIPFAIQYWERFATKVIVYDNGSTDGSIEMLQKYDWIEVRHFTYPNGINDLQLQNLKNHIWKEARYQADYVCVCDMDEFFYTKSIGIFFNYLKKNGITICKPQGINLHSFKFPKFNGEELMHEIINKGFDSEKFSKTIIFDPLAIEEINYFPGAHVCNPKGNIIWYDKNDIYLYHAKYLGIDYLFERRNISGSKLSRFNKGKGFGFEYLTENKNTLMEFVDVYKWVKAINEEKSSKIQWEEPEINGVVNNSSCAIVIPVYTPTLSTQDHEALNQIINILGGKYDIWLLSPLNLDLSVYHSLNYNFNVAKCSTNFFKSKWTYNELCQTYEFYEMFKDYKYMLIYQLDAWVFSDKLEYFINGGYDYIGAPHRVHENDDDEDEKDTIYTVGNGGFSLRKIDKFIELCQKYSPTSEIFEDVYFSKYLSFELKLPTVKEAFEFSIQESPKTNLIRLGHLPFGCHYYRKENYQDYEN